MRVITEVTENTVMKLRFYMCQYTEDAVASGSEDSCCCLFQISDLIIRVCSIRRWQEWLLWHV